MFIKLNLIKVLICLLAIQCFSSCEHKVHNDDAVPQLPNDTNIIKTDTVRLDSICFENDILPIFKSNCAIEACHDGITGQEGIVFDSYKTFFYKGFVSGDALKSQVYNAIIRKTSRRMPPMPMPPLDSNQIATIKKWIDQGMPERTCRQVIDTNKTSFQYNVSPIIKNYCYGCHNTQTQYPNTILLENYAQIKSFADNGKLLGSIQHKITYKAMPLNAQKMDEKLIRIIEKWIENGALNN
ncbi:MAG TPA: hypothetical protein VGF79_12875 [Bacteroidia bacterium]